MGWSDGRIRDMMMAWDWVSWVLHMIVDHTLRDGLSGSNLNYFTDLSGLSPLYVNGKAWLPVASPIILDIYQGVSWSFQV